MRKEPTHNPVFIAGVLMGIPPWGLLGTFGLGVQIGGMLTLLTFFSTILWDNL